jgi:hypothetical protein
MTLDSLQRVDLFGDEYMENAIQLVGAIKAVMGTPGLDSATVRAAVDEADDATRPAILRRHTEEMIHDQTQVIPLDALRRLRGRRQASRGQRDPRRPIGLPARLRRDRSLAAASVKANLRSHCSNSGRCERRTSTC